MRISDWSSDVCSSDLEGAGLVLLVAMIGAIVLTQRQRGGTRPQNIARQNARRPWEAIRKVQPPVGQRSEEHTSELQSLMRISYAVFCLKKKTQHNTSTYHLTTQRHIAQTDNTR